MTEEDLAGALETVSSQLGRLTEWNLRPARVESLMKACAEFMSRRTDQDDNDREMFGHLSLPAIEMICESWSRLGGVRSFRFLECHDLISFVWVAC